MSTTSTNTSCPLCGLATEPYCVYCEEPGVDTLTVEPACLQDLVLSAQFIAAEERAVADARAAADVNTEQQEHWLSVLNKTKDRYIGFRKDFGATLSIGRVDVGLPEIKSVQLDRVGYKTARSKSDGRVLTVEVQPPFEVCVLTAKTKCMLSNNNNNETEFIRVVDVIEEWRGFLLEMQTVLGTCVSA